MAEAAMPIARLSPTNAVLKLVMAPSDSTWSLWSQTCGTQGGARACSPISLRSWGRSYRSVPAELGAADDEVVDLVRAVSDPQGALAGVHLGERRPLRHAGGAVDLDRLVDDLADPLGDHGLDHVHPHAGLAIAQHVH